MLASALEAPEAAETHSPDTALPVVLGVKAQGPSGEVNAYICATRTTRPPPSPSASEMASEAAAAGTSTAGDNNASAAASTAGESSSFIAAEKANAEETERDRRMASVLGLPRRPWQRYRPMVRSVLARAIAHDREFHRLFCRYQTSVHGDSDPFSADDDKKDDKGGGSNTDERAATAVEAANGGGGGSSLGLAAAAAAPTTMAKKRRNRSHSERIGTTSSRLP